MELEYLLRHGGPREGGSRRYTKVLCCIIHPSNSLQGYGVAVGGEQCKVCHAEGRQGGYGVGLGWVPG